MDLRDMLFFWPLLATLAICGIINCSNNGQYSSDMVGCLYPSSTRIDKLSVETISYNRLVTLGLKEHYLPTRAYIFD